IVDDGSTDNTEVRINKLMEIYQSYKIVYQYFKENKGPAFARNRGAELSQGEYIAFLDSDDLWLKNKLKYQIDFMKKNNYLISQTEEIWIRNGKRVNPMEKHRKPTGDIFEKSLKFCTVSPSSVMIKREVFFELGGFDESFLACEDYDLWLRLSLKYPVYLLPKRLIIKRGGLWEHQSKKIPHLDRLR
ncbi:MAG: glycosyltransferase family 2 protein, partial [Proteobacteria bacterium]|nr:glycosyltransferase family 2 protein [Pseudomonadota bacterium]